MRVKEDSEKAGLKLDIKKTKILAVSPITSWKIWGKSGNSEEVASYESLHLGKSIPKAFL